MVLLVLVLLVCFGLGLASVHTNLILGLIGTALLLLAFIGTFVLNTYLANNEASIGYYESQSWPLYAIIQELYRLASPNVKIAVLFGPLVFIIAREGLKGYYFLLGRKPQKRVIF